MIPKYFYLDKLLEKIKIVDTNLYLEEAILAAELVFISESAAIPDIDYEDLKKIISKSYASINTKHDHIINIGEKIMKLKYNIIKRTELQNEKQKLEQEYEIMLSDKAKLLSIRDLINIRNYTDILARNLRLLKNLNSEDEDSEYILQSLPKRLISIKKHLTVGTEGFDLEEAEGLLEEYINESINKNDTNLKALNILLRKSAQNVEDFKNQKPNKFAFWKNKDEELKIANLQVTSYKYQILQIQERTKELNTNFEEFMKFVTLCKSLLEAIETYQKTKMPSKPPKPIASRSSRKRRISSANKVKTPSKRKSP